MTRKREYYKHPYLGWGWHEPKPATTTPGTYTMRIEAIDPGYDRSVMYVGGSRRRSWGQICEELDQLREAYRKERDANSGWHKEVARVLGMSKSDFRYTSRQQKIERLEHTLADSRACGCPCRMGQCPGSRDAK
jgi:hypothetical protein